MLDTGIRKVNNDAEVNVFISRVCRLARSSVSLMRSCREPKRGRAMEQTWSLNSVSFVIFFVVEGVCAYSCVVTKLLLLMQVIEEGLYINVEA